MPAGQLKTGIGEESQQVGLIPLDHRLQFTAALLPNPIDQRLEQLLADTAALVFRVDTDGVEHCDGFGATKLSLKHVTGDEARNLTHNLCAQRDKGGRILLLGPQPFAKKIQSRRAAELLIKSDDGL